MVLYCSPLKKKSFRIKFKKFPDKLQKAFNNYVELASPPQVGWVHPCDDKTCHTLPRS